MLDLNAIHLYENHPRVSVLQCPAIDMLVGE
jgi:hypothetical protein